MADSTLSTLYVDGVRVDDVVSLYDLNTRLLGGQKWDSPNRFWASPPRLGTSTDRDVLEVSLNAPKWTNHFSFQVSRFPCRMWLLWFDNATDQWVPVRDRKSKRPVQITINQSVPSRLYPDVKGNEHRHPHHKDPNHWERVDIPAEAMVASKFRLVMVRLPSNNVPTGHGTRLPIPYSLAVKEFQPGFEVVNKADVPHSQSSTQSVKESISFASSVDLLGSPVEFSLVEYKASDLLWPTLQKIAGVLPSQRSGKGEVWRSEPQPVPYAVVNLYVDARDGHGQGQTVDRFQVDTITTGVSCNLYYSNDTLESHGFEASDEALRFPAIRPHGIVSVSEEGTLFPSEPPVEGDPTVPAAYLDIDSTVIQWSDDKNWWFGLRFQPQFDSTSTDDWVLLDMPRCRIIWDGSMSSWVFEIDGSTIVRDNHVFDRNERLNLAVRWTQGLARVNMSGDWSADVVTDANSTGNLPDSVPANSPLRHTLRFGGLLTGSDPGLGGYRLNAFILKQETLDTDRRVEYFDTDEGLYLRKPDINEDPRSYTRNALLRILPYYQTPGPDSRNPFGVLGGPGTPYESLVWTPINREFKLHKGYLSFDPVKARFFKFEFTNLAPQPYDSFEPVLRRVKLFTDETIGSSIGLRSTSGKVDRSKGTDVSLVALRRPLYSDQNRLVTQIDPFRSYDGYTPTEAYYSSDPRAQERLSAINPAFRLQPWHRPLGAPRFVSTQQHYYETITIRHTAKVAYSVGLSELRMFRVDYTAADDTDAYLMPFHDRVGLDDEHDTLPWSSIPEGGLLSPGLIPSSGAVTTSQPLLSRRNVRGVQFATMQTPPHQTLADPDFDDPTLTYWTEYGDATIAPSTEFNSNIGSTVKITRHASVDGGQVSEDADWTDIEALGTWDEIEDINPHPNYPTWDDIAQITETSIISYGGVEGSLDPAALVQPPAKGRMYAAARAYCPEGVNAPLRVQIVAANGSVLADAQVQPKAGQITEWFCSYQIGSAGFTGVDPTQGQPVAIVHPSAITSGTVTGASPAAVGDDSTETFVEGVFSTPSASLTLVQMDFAVPMTVPSVSPVVTLAATNAGAGSATAQQIRIELEDIGTDGTDFYAQWYVDLWGLGQIITLTDWPLAASITYPVTSQVARWQFTNYTPGAGAQDSPWNEAKARLAAGDLRMTVTRMSQPGDVDPLDRKVQVYEAGLTYPFSGETWDEVSTGRTWNAMEAVGTWDQIAGLGFWDPGGAGRFTAYSGPVTARVFQDGPTNDVFYIDNLSLYEDPIVWEFSNNGGIDWFPALDIRNDPHGVLLFPSTPQDTLTPSQDTSLRWRVSAYQPDQRVKYLVIRPWYSTLPLGVPSRETIQHGGPNVSQYDQYPDIVDSPPFKVWHKPIPEDWWFIHRQWVPNQAIISTPEFTPLYLPETIVYSP